MVACCSIYRSFLQIKIVQKLGKSPCYQNDYLTIHVHAYLPTTIAAWMDGWIHRFADVLLRTVLLTMAVWYTQNELIMLLFFLLLLLPMLLLLLWPLFLLLRLCGTHSVLSFVIFITLLTTQLFHDWLCIKNVFRLLKMLTVLLAASHLSLWFHCYGQKRDDVICVRMHREKEATDSRWNWKTRELKLQRKQFALCLRQHQQRKQQHHHHHHVGCLWYQIRQGWHARKPHCCGRQKAYGSQQYYEQFTVRSSHMCAMCGCVFNPVIDAVEHMNIKFAEKWSDQSFQKLKPSMFAKKCNKKTAIKVLS